MRRLTLVLVAVLLALAVAAMANPAFKAAFDKTYKPKGALLKAGCVTCHVKAGSSALNPYGKSLMGKPATAASFKAVEKLDSDKDGYSNGMEIKAGMLPGNAKSKPAGKADCAPPKKK